MTRDPLVHVIQHGFVDIAPAPVLTGLEEGAHDGMAGAMEMFAVVVFTEKALATADISHTPGISEGEPNNSPSLSTLHSLRECAGDTSRIWSRMGTA